VSAEYLLAELRCAALRARLWQADIEAVGVALRGGSLARRMYDLYKAGDFLFFWDALNAAFAPSVEPEKPDAGNGADPEQSADKRREEFATLDAATDGGAAVIAATTPKSDSAANERGAG
jgi:hypothetical protein